MRFVIALALLPLVGCVSQPTAEQATARRSIAAVVSAFQSAIAKKDKGAYMSLFFSDGPEEVGWQAVVDDALLTKIQRERPQAIKARARPENNFVALIDSVVANPVATEERVSGLSIDTDGEVGSAAFDYQYVADGKVTNFGRELWQLVRTEAGWKIFSVVYTIRQPAP